MYERYAEPARYAVYYSTRHARLDEATEIDSIHLLKALMWEEGFRSNSIFQLRERFPLHRGCPWKFASIENVPERENVLTNEVKRILARTAQEANAMRDYWIDTEHLLLGILTEPSCAAAQYLSRTGLRLKEARRRVIENKPSRPDYGPVFPGWGQSPLKRWLSKWRMHKFRHENT